MGEIREFPVSKDSSIDKEVNDNQHLVGRRVRISMTGTITNVAVDEPGGFDITMDDPLEDNFWWNTKYPFELLDDEPTNNRKEG